MHIPAQPLIVRIALAACVAMAAAWPSAARAREPSYEVELSAPRALREPLEADLDLYRWREAEEAPDAELLGRLALEAEAQARELLAARGYVSAEVRARVEVERKPMRVRLEVVPGKATRIATAEISFQGAILESEDALDRAALEDARAGFAELRGKRFTQTHWEEAKRAALDRLLQRRWAAAAITVSEARIDPASARAELTLAIDSGPPFRFGALEVEGLERYRARRVDALRPYEPGEIYDRERLVRFQRRLAGTGYFASAHVRIDASPANADAAPVRVSLIEAAARRVELGLGYGTDRQAYGSAEYRDHDFGAHALRLRARIEADLLVQGVESELGLPERTGWSDTLGGRLEHTSIEDLTTDELSLVAKTSALDEHSQPSFSATFALSRQRAAGVLSESVNALLLEYTHTWRATDDLIAPRRGVMAQLRVGGAPPGVSSREFARAIARGAAYLPLGERDDLAFRAEAGAVIAGDTLGIPQSMLFRTGGSTSVRGYDLESLGVEAGDAVLGGRYLLVASAEYTHWFRERIGGALFVDAGNARDDLHDFPLALGLGAGVRAASPIGPLRFDVAYGERDRAVRVHFSLGLTF